MRGVSIALWVAHSIFSFCMCAQDGSSCRSHTLAVIGCISVLARFCFRAVAGIHNLFGDCAPMSIEFCRYGNTLVCPAQD